MNQEPLFEVKLARSETGGFPFVAFLNSETDAKIRARLLSKVDHLSRHAPEDLTRPLVDTLDGPIKEVRTGQIRILFSLEQETGIMLFFGGERKKTGPVSPSLIEEAVALRQRWLVFDDAIPLDVPEFRRRMRRKKIRWPND